MRNLDFSFPPRIDIIPDKALVDERVSIRPSGFVPNQLITVRARMQDDFGQCWESSATFKTNTSGTIDLGTQKPLSGTYDEVDPMGLFWSMVSTEKEASYFAKTTLAPIMMTFVVEVDNKAVASASLERLFVASDIIRTPARENGLVGTLFRSTGSGERPGIIVLGGSDGALLENGAALLASRGYATLALAYFAIEHLPTKLINIPLEYFEIALRWMQSQDGVNGDKLAVIGASKGGELALLLGATFPQVKAVVSYVGSGLVHSGPGNCHTDLIWQKSSWSYHGKPLPFVPIRVTLSEAVSAGWKLLAGKQIPGVPFFLKTLEDSDAKNKATISVEKINGPVLLISGEDDQVWPSTAFSETVTNRLAEHNHPHSSKHLSYKRAGHVICLPYEFPYMPAMFRHEGHPVTGMIITCGGNAKDNAFAISDSWPQVLKFLQDSLN